MFMYEFAAMLHLFASLILLCKFALILPGTHSLSHRKNMFVHVFLNPRCMNVRYFELA